MKMIRIEFPPELHNYLIDVVRQHSRNGHEPEEGLVLFHLWNIITKSAQVFETEPLPPCDPPGNALPQPQNSDAPVEIRTPHPHPDEIEAVYNNDNNVV